MNPKIKKIQEEILKNEERVAQAQFKVKELRRELIEAENTELISAMRSIEASPEDLKALLERIAEQTNTAKTNPPESNTETVESGEA